MPDEFKDYMLGWLLIHPGWQVYIWTLKNIPALENQKEFDDAPSMAIKSSILRVELVNKFGGIFIDPDFECYQSIEPLLDRTVLIGHETADSLCDALIGGMPGQPFFEKAIRGFPQWYEMKRDQKHPIQAPYPPAFGPEYLTHVYGLHDWQFEPVKNQKLLYPYFVGEKPQRFPETIAAHHWAGTWHE